MNGNAGRRDAPGSESESADELTAKALHEAVWHRVEVSQAVGMVMAQLGVDPDEALERLRTYGLATDQTISEVAAAVVSREVTFAMPGASIRLL